MTPRMAQVGDQVLCIDPADDLIHGELYDVVGVQANRLKVQLPPNDERKTSILLTHLRERFEVRAVQETP